VTRQPQQPNEQEIRQCLEAGQYREALERLLGLYSMKVFHLAYSMVRDETQAEDMAQEIFLRVWKGLPGYNGQAALSTWIYTIARNTCLTEIKRRAMRPTVSLDEPGFKTSIETLESLQTTQPEPGIEMDIEKLLEQLPHNYRQVITLFYLEQKSYEEVSVLLGLPLGTVKTFLFRAKKELRRIAARLVPVGVVT
jgi:RNA polymerase sigma-70 factor, ECF subfamily